MSSGPPDAAAASMPSEDVTDARRTRITYSREFLLSVGGSEPRRNELPAGIDAAVLGAMRWHWGIWDRGGAAAAQRSSRSGAAVESSPSRVERWVARSRRSQGDDDSPGELQARETESSGTSAGSKSKTCTRFFSTDGCRFGDDCRFLHHLHGSHHDQAVAKMNSLSLDGPALARPPPGRTPKGSAVPDRAPRPTTPGTVKSRLCKNYDTAEGCRWGDRYYFAHGEGELGREMGRGSSFKTRLCESFFATGSCSFGGRCHFAHGENELRKPAAY